MMGVEGQYVLLTFYEEPDVLRKRINHKEPNLLLPIHKHHYGKHGKINSTTIRLDLY